MQLVEDTLPSGHCVPISDIWKWGIVEKDIWIKTNHWGDMVEEEENPSSSIEHVVTNNQNKEKLTVVLSKSQRKMLKRLQNSSIGWDIKSPSLGWSFKSCLIKVIFWNAWGLASQPTHDFLKQLCLSHKPDFLLLIEPWMNPDLFPNFLLEFF